MSPIIRGEKTEMALKKDEKVAVTIDGRATEWFISC